MHYRFHRTKQSTSSCYNKPPTAQITDFFHYFTCVVSPWQPLVPLILLYFLNTIFPRSLHIEELVYQPWLPKEFIAPSFLPPSTRLSTIPLWKSLFVKQAGRVGQLMNCRDICCKVTTMVKGGDMGTNKMHSPPSSAVFTYLLDLSLFHLSCNHARHWESYLILKFKCQ